MIRWNVRFFGRVATLALFGLAVSCDDVETTTDEPVVGGVLWDHVWTVESTNIELEDGSQIPLPTDRELLEKIRYGEGGAPPVGDVLAGAELVFEVDGRVLVQPAGASEAAYYGTDYRVIEEGLLRASVRKSVWFKYTYAWDEVTETLLFNPEEKAGDALLDLVLEIISRTLYSGALDSAAARVTEFLFEDPRVATAIDQFLYDLIHGRIAAIPVQDPADVTAWLILQLREAEIVDPETPDKVLEALISPIVEELLPLDREGIARALTDRILGSELVTEISPERFDKLLSFLLYRRLIDTGQQLGKIETTSLLLSSKK